MNFRKARKDDIPEIVKMLSNDELGKLREDYQEPLPDKYYHAFESINSDVNQKLIVVENNENEIIGTFQLTFTQYLTYEGGIRAHIEAVRVREDQRGKGIGEKLFEWAINACKVKGVHLLQLTTDKKRPMALEFYKKLGFTNSHEGLKLHFNQINPVTITI
jgi:GNAT superfamily N-acetyltransferase